MAASGSHCLLWFNVYIVCDCSSESSSTCFHSYRVSSLSSASRPSRRAEAPAAVCGGGEEAFLGRGQSSGMERQIVCIPEIVFAQN